MCTFFAPNKRNLLAAPPWTRLPRRRHAFLQDLRLISKYLFFGCPRIPARTPPSSFPLAARMRSSHTRKKCFFFALLSRKTRILPALLILQVGFAFFRTSLQPSQSSLFFLVAVFAGEAHFTPAHADGRRCAGGLGTRSAHNATYNVAGPTSSPRLLDSQSGFANRKQQTHEKLVLQGLKALPIKLVSGWHTGEKGGSERGRG